MHARVGKRVVFRSFIHQQGQPTLTVIGLAVNVFVLFRLTRQDCGNKRDSRRVRKARCR
jgi:hypothetical protein